MFVSTVRLDRDTLTEISNYMTAKWKKYFLIGIGILCFIFVFVAMKSNDIFAVVMCALIAAIIGYSMIIKPLKWGNRQYMAIENSGVSYFDYKTTVNDDNILVENLSTGWSGDLLFYRFDKLVITPNLYVLFTTNGRYVLISRKELGEEGLTKLIAHLKTKNTRIKWKRMRL